MDRGFFDLQGAPRHIMCSAQPLLMPCSDEATVQAHVSMCRQRDVVSRACTCMLCMTSEMCFREACSRCIRHRDSAKL